MALRHFLLAATLLASATGAAAQENTRVIHSPWLALRIEQGGADVPLRFGGDLLTDADLAAAPFTIVLPVRGDDDTYWLAAGADAAIFAETDPDSRRNLLDSPGLPAFFMPDTGTADTAASSGVLMIDPTVHHHLTGLRLGPDLDRHIFYVSEISSRDEAGDLANRRIEDIDTPLHLVVWFDENGDGTMHFGEYEFLTLHFGNLAAN